MIFLLVYLLYTSPTKTADYSMLVASKQQIGDPDMQESYSNSRLGVYSTSSRVQDVHVYLWYWSHTSASRI